MKLFENVIEDGRHIQKCSKCQYVSGPVIYDLPGQGMKIHYIKMHPAYVKELK